MKKLSFCLLFLSLGIEAHTITLSDYNYSVRDIREKNLTKEDVYQKMNRKLVRSKDSICSNRAHVWAWDFQVNNIDSPKIFLFFTPKTGTFDGFSWWYHVSPLVNENGKLWVMDAGYPKKVQEPLSIKEWMKRFNGKDSVCKEIRSHHKDLIGFMAQETAFPEETEHGKYSCYYKITPPGYWTPAQIVRNLTGEEFSRDVMEESEVMQACIETSTSPLGWLFRSTKEKCRDFISNGSLRI
ncbi:MAG: protein-glutamine glutaminase family protein [Bacteriovoracia bacterium]